MLKKITIWFLALIVLLGTAALIWNNRFTLHDDIVLHGYQAPATIAALANDDTFTAKGKRYFYVNKPQISDRSSFNNECKTVTKEQTIVLGCYTGTNIYIFKVTDPRLNGVEQVTAAHEMLHSAYDRLSPSERKKVDAMVNAEYQKLNDPRLTALAASYSKSEPGSVTDEMHSILGTEEINVGPQLEAYYSQYFTDRSKIVAYSNNYEQVFDNMKNQVEQYDADLALRKTEIDQLEASLQTQNQQLDAQKSNLDNLSASGQTRAYNNQVPAYNDAVNNYNAGVANLKSLIAEYNNIVSQRNNLAVQQQSLAQSIDSQLNIISNQ